MSDIRPQDRSHDRLQDRLKTRPAQPRELTIIRKQNANGESRTMMAIIMAGIAGLFIVAIVAGYHYVSSPSTALRDNPPASASAPATRSPPETTGSGSSLPAERQVPDKSMKQQ
jgi:hypothetical protein